MTYVNVKSKDGKDFKAYVALPKKPAPAVIVVQEIFGVNQEIKDKCHEIAEWGYVAIAPDLFWRIEPGIELMDDKPKELKRAFELYGIFDVEKGMDDLHATVEFAKKFDGCTGEIGSIGYCLGGMLSYRLGCEGNLKAAASYYGVGIDTMLDMARNNKTNILLHLAENDEFVPPEAQEKIKLSLMPDRRFQIHSYPGCDHAFARTDGMHYNPTAAIEANKITREFFSTYMPSNI